MIEQLFRRFAIMSAQKGDDGIKMEKIVTTHTEDWTTDSTGNSSNFVSTYFNKGDGLYLATITDNSVTGKYKAISAVYAKGTINGVNTTVGRALRGNGDVTTGTSVSFYVAAGSVVTIWYAAKGELEQ